MGTYIKRRIEVEAFRLGHDEPPYWALSAALPDRDAIRLRDGWDHVEIPTPEGRMSGHRGDWLIRGVAGEFYPCKHHIFIKTYDAVGDFNPDDYADVPF